MKTSENRTKFKNLRIAAKKLGYLKDQSGILKRYIDQEGGWKSHIDNSKNYIKESAIPMNKNKVAVLGSGWLLDVPLKFLSENFKEVFLIDIYHPKYVKRIVKKYPNTYLFTEDLTGGCVLSIYENQRTIKHDGLKWLNNLKLNDHFFYRDFDFVISLNILNQLDIIVIDYLNSKSGFNESDMVFLRKAIQENHLRSLPIGRSCFISDIVEISIDQKGIEVSEKNLIYSGLNNLINKREWKWNFDLSYTYQEDYNTIFKVIAGQL